jgi:uncharacterized membrane protein
VATPVSIARGPRVLAVLALLAASALCVATLEIRMERTGDSFYQFLVWNLFLAWVPLICAAAAFARARRGIDAVVIALLLLWLLFFPNAPYMLTDFIHVGESPSVPLWYDALMLSSFAWTALLLGFASLYLVQIVVRGVVGAAWSWVVVAAALALSSFGVYLGRFVRFNSWDALLRPGRVAQVISNQLENPLHHPRMVAVLVVLTAFLLVGYVVLYAFVELGIELRHAGRRMRR